MAASPIIPKNGALTLGTYIANYGSYDIESAQATENISGYGTNTCSANAGSGTPDFSFNVGAFALAHAVGTAPAMPTLEAAGVTTTFTLDTGVTEACTMIRQSVRIGHARMRAAVPLTIRGKNAGDVTEVWVTT